MRPLLAVVAVLLLAATDVYASTFVRLEYTGGSTAQSKIKPNRVIANVSDTLSFDIVVEVGTPGVEALAFDLQWMDDELLTLVSTSFESGSTLIPNKPPTLANFLVPDAPAVNDGVGLIGNIGWQPAVVDSALGFTAVPKPPLGEVFLGSLVFHVGGPGLSMVQTGFFQEGSSAINSKGKFFTPGFTKFQVKNGAFPVPEPGAASLLLLGLGGLWLAGNSSRAGERD